MVLKTRVRSRRIILQILLNYHHQAGEISKRFMKEPTPRRLGAEKMYGRHSLKNGSQAVGQLQKANTE